MRDKKVDFPDTTGTYPIKDAVWVVRSQDYVDAGPELNTDLSDSPIVGAAWARTLSSLKEEAEREKRGTADPHDASARPESDMDNVVRFDRNLRAKLHTAQDQQRAAQQPESAANNHDSSRAAATSTTFRIRFLRMLATRFKRQNLVRLATASTPGSRSSRFES